MKILLSAAILAVLSFPAIAHAQGPGMMKACAPDLQALCPTAATMGDKHKCLMANAGKTSNDCQVAMTAAANEGSAFRAACRADIQQYCKGIAPGEQRRQCIAQNTANFSANCQAELAKHPGATRQ